MAIRVVVADDHPVFRHGLKTLLLQEGFCVEGEASDGREAVELTGQRRPDVVLLDYSMPHMNGLETARQILTQFPRAKVILLTVHREEQFMIAALNAGVRGYVLKSEAATAVVQAIREVDRGNAYVSPRVAGTAVDLGLACARSGSAADIVSPRELQVLKLIAEGHTTKEVAEVLGLTVKTAESYRTCLMNKLDIHDTAGLVRYAVRRGLVTP